MLYLNSGVLSQIFLLILLANHVACKCVLQISTTNAPLITQKFGSKELLLTPLDPKVDLDDNAKIQAFCATGFNAFNVMNAFGYHIVYNIRNKHSLSFQCVSNKLYVFEENDEIVPKVEEHEITMPNMIGCKGSVYSTYESRDKLPNCNNALSYALGAKLNTPIILAALCYELNRLHLKYISYKLHEPYTMLEKAQQYYPEGLSSSSLAEPLLPIEFFYPFPSQSNITDYIRHKAESNFWLRFASYELDNIVQTNNNTLRTKLDEFKNLFNIIWWSNLKIGNWRRFMDLLEKRAERVNYNIYTGTSGAVRIPKLTSCENESKLVINHKGNKRNIAEFVWTYLKSTSENVVEDFVVIGFNSPYYENFNKNSTILCRDMCNEIDWLSSLNDSRHISNLGVLYCCKPEAVVGLLDGFPLKQKSNTYNYNSNYSSSFTSTLPPAINPYT